MRGSLVDVRLAEQVFAPHYAVPSPHVATRRQDVLAQAGDPATVRSEILPGETFEVLELSADWAWGRCAADGSVGFVANDGLSGTRVSELPAPPASRDLVQVAERLVGVAARAGGRSRHGVDAAGLVFLAMAEAGIAAPRFLEHQLLLGTPVDPAAPVERGELVFFDRHVAIMVDDSHVVHAGPDTVERVPLGEVEQRMGPVVARRRLA